MSRYTGLLAAAVGLSLVSSAGAVATWPSPAYDELEDLMLLNTGVNARNFFFPLQPCTFAPTAGHSVPGGFLRTAFHDMAPADITAGTGGLDASIGFELLDPYVENTGPAFNATLTFYSKFFNSRASMSDLIALGVYASVRACGGPAVPVKAGRIDATGPGAVGVPDAKDDITKLKSEFARMGFSPTEMIQVVACGHTLGGVHSAEHPTIVPANATLGVQNFDTTNNTYDNLVVTQYLDGSTNNPLVIGPDIAARSDLRIFSSDNNSTVSKMSDSNSYGNTCSTILGKMIDTVPSGVELSSNISPYPVKPANLQLNVAPGGSSLIFSGQIRFWTNSIPSSSISSLKIAYKDKKRVSAGEIEATVLGSTAGLDDSFMFYQFSGTILAKNSISSFTVIVTTSSGTNTYDNNGKGFPVDDTIFVQTANSTLAAADSKGNQVANIIAAVRSSSTENVTLDISLINRMTYNNLPTINKTTVLMTKLCASEFYNFYQASYTIPAAAVNLTKYDVSVGSSSDSFNSFSGLPATAAAFTCGGRKTSTSTASSTSSASKTTWSVYASGTATSSVYISSTMKSNTWWYTSGTFKNTSSTGKPTSPSYTSIGTTNTWGTWEDHKGSSPPSSSSTSSGSSTQVADVLTSSKGKPHHSKTDKWSTSVGAVSKSTSTELVSYTTTVVTSYETYCSSPTRFTQNGKVYPVTEATIVTVTDCPCTIVLPWTNDWPPSPSSSSSSSAVVAAVSTNTWSYNPANSAAATLGSTVAAAVTSSSSAPGSSSKLSNSSSVSPAVATFTGGAGSVTVSGQGLPAGIIILGATFLFLM